MTVDRFDHLHEAALAGLDARVAGQGSQRWDAFYADRAKPCPFFGTLVDESLAGWVDAGAIPPGRAIDLGCGNARNSIFLAGRGFEVDAVDLSPAAIAWASERVAAAGASVALRCASVFELELAEGGYDLVYDGGCFHHIAPHRRPQYIALVTRALKPGGWFGLTCFRPEGGSGYTDEQVYERGSTGGGLGYTEQRLRELWSDALQVHEVRQMNEPAAGTGLFGKDFLWVLRACKR
jgi:SAM-dependent methyltransferase